MPSGMKFDEQNLHNGIPPNHSYLWVQVSGNETLLFSHDNRNSSQPISKGKPKKNLNYPPSLTGSHFNS